MKLFLSVFALFISSIVFACGSIEAVMTPVLYETDILMKDGTRKSGYVFYKTATLPSHLELQDDKALIYKLKNDYDSEDFSFALYSELSQIDSIQAAMKKNIPGGLVSAKSNSIDTIHINDVKTAKIINAKRVKEFHKVEDGLTDYEINQLSTKRPQVAEIAKFLDPETGHYKSLRNLIVVGYGNNHSKNEIQKIYNKYVEEYLFTLDQIERYYELIVAHYKSRGYIVLEIMAY